jgi:large conductance mechanosensitive channel
LDVTRENASSCRAKLRFALLIVRQFVRDADVGLNFGLGGIWRQFIRPFGGRMGTSRGCQADAGQGAGQRSRARFAFCRIGFVTWRPTTVSNQNSALQPADFPVPHRGRTRRRRQSGENRMGIANEFVAFVKRGNVIDLAVGVIIGAAFGKIVSSLVADVIMPPVGYLVGGVNFTELIATIGGGDKPVTINYGNFLQTVFDFLIIAFCVFLMVKAVNTLYRKDVPKPAEPPAQEKLLTEIRDLLKSRA